jgi:hypothetical protein
MKTITTAVAATLITASVSAADFYYGFGEGNPDLVVNNHGSDFSGVQPSVGDNFDSYQKFTDGNPDIFQPVDEMSTVRHSASADEQPIYVGPGRTL